MRVCKNNFNDSPYANSLRLSGANCDQRYCTCLARLKIVTRPLDDVLNLSDKCAIVLLLNIQIVATGSHNCARF